MREAKRMGEAWGPSCQGAGVFAGEKIGITLNPSGMAY